MTTTDETREASTSAEVDEQAERSPRISRAQWTFDLTGECIYCGKKCTRQRTFDARTLNDAQAQADAAMGGLCHRKCGGY